jgi:hypothetical protein
MNRLCRRLWCPDRRLVAACCLVAAAGVAPRTQAADGPEAAEPMNSVDQAELPLQRSLPARRLAPPPTSTLEMETRRQVSAAAAEDRWRMRYVRWSGTPQSTAVGVSVGVGAQRLTPALPLEAARASSQVAPELGVRMRTGWRDDRRVDVDAWRSYERPLPGEAAAEGGPSNNARVELQFRAPKDAHGLDVPRGAFGIQTSANSQWVLRAKRGGPMVYYRARW